MLLSDQQSVSLSAAPVSAPKVQAALLPWEIPEECVLEGLEFWQTGHFGPICKGLLKKRDGASSAVVVESLRGTESMCQNEKKPKRFLICFSIVTKGCGRTKLYEKLRTH